MSGRVIVGKRPSTKADSTYHWVMFLLILLAFGLRLHIPRLSWGKTDITYRKELCLP